MAVVKKDSSARRFPRIRVRLHGTLEHRDSWTVTVLDLSVSGCLLRCPVLLDVGSIVDVAVALADAPFGAKARVVNAALDGEALPGPAQYLLGLDFMGLPLRDETALRQFLDHTVRQRKDSAADA